MKNKSNRQQLIIKLNNIVNNNNNYRYIAKTILENINDLKKYSIVQIAQKSYSSASSIVRFCQFLGLSGYKELKQILVNNIESFDLKTTEFNAIINANILEINQMILETMNILNFTNLEHLIFDLTQSNKQIILIGYGESSLFLEIFASRLLRLGIYTKSFTEEDLTLFSKLANENTIIVAFSLSGKTKLVLNAISLSKQNNAKVYAFTQFANNPLKQLADFSFDISYNLENNQYITNAPRYAVLFLFDYIFEKIILSNPNKFLTNLKLTAKKPI